MAETLSIEYRHHLAIAKEEAGEIKDITYLRSLNRVEAQRRIHRNIRVMEKKLKGGCTSRVQVTNIDGTVKEYITKQPMEEVIAISNKKMAPNRRRQ